MEKTLILLTNDDGIHSPGLHAAARALLPLGEVVVVAPREQQTSMGRSLPPTSDGRIEAVSLPVNGETVRAYALGGTPAQCVLHAVLEILPRTPALVVSGINYGENIGTGVTISGTVGAALEGGAMGIPSLAVSQAIEGEEYYAYTQVDFSTAATFTALFAQKLLSRTLPVDVDVLKVDVPLGATPQTPWRVTRQSRHRYYIPYLIREGGWDQKGFVSASPRVRLEDTTPDDDIRAVVFDRVVSVTPLSVDLTSRTDLEDLEDILR